MPVDIEVFDPTDKTLLGPAEVVLRMPGIVDHPNWTPDLGLNERGEPFFDFTRNQQAWKADPAIIPGDINGYRLVGGINDPRLIEYYVPADWAKTPNIQDNPSKDGIVFPYAPVPMRGLEHDEKLVMVRVGTYFPSLFVRKGEKPALAPAPGGGVIDFTSADRAKLDEILLRVRSLTV